MESLESLKSRQRELEKELEKITINHYSTTPWAPGVQDQFKSESHAYQQYTDIDKARRLKNEIANLENQIRTYASRAQTERERQEALIDMQRPRYEYTAAGVTETTRNPALAARYEAQQRLYGMNKLQQTLMAITGQKRKFKKLWLKSASASTKTQEEVAEELNKLFR